jgi:hypothetical protein
VSAEPVVYWNNYEQHKVEVEASIRHKIYNDIQDVIAQSKNKSLSDEFVAGLQCAQSAILGFSSHNVDKTLQEELF